MLRQAKPCPRVKPARDANLTQNRPNMLFSGPVSIPKRFTKWTTSTKKQNPHRIRISRQGRMRGFASFHGRPARQFATSPRTTKPMSPLMVNIQSSMSRSKHGVRILSAFMRAPQMTGWKHQARSGRAGSWTTYGALLPTHKERALPQMIAAANKAARLA